MNKYLAKLTSNPRAVFLLDGAGALLSALLLTTLAFFSTAFGLPQNTFFTLAGIAGLFCLYSFGCHRFVRHQWRPFLIIIALANSFYSLLTLYLVYQHYAEITILGLAYFLPEVLIIGILVFIELTTVMKKR